MPKRVYVVSRQILYEHSFTATYSALLWHECDPTRFVRRWPIGLFPFLPFLYRRLFKLGISFVLNRAIVCRCNLVSLFPLAAFLAEPIGGAYTAAVEWGSTPTVRIFQNGI